MGLSCCGPHWWRLSRLCSEFISKGLEAVWISPTCLFSEEINSHLSTRLWVLYQRRGFCFSVQGFRSTGWRGGLLVSSPGRGPSSWDRAHCPLPVAGWSRSTPCPRAGRWSTPQRESDILWTTTRAAPPLKTPDLGLSQGKYSLSPSSQTCFLKKILKKKSKYVTGRGKDILRKRSLSFSSQIWSELNQLLF